MVKPTKVVVCGQRGIGKTCLLEQLLYQNYANQDLYPTMEDVYVASVDTDRGTKEVLRIYDTEGVDAGTEGEIGPLKPYHATADAFILIYRTDSLTSFQLVQVIWKDVDKNRDKRDVVVVAVALLGTNSDRRQVNSSSAIGWASREKLHHFEVSLNDRQSVVAPFVYIASKTNLPPGKSSFAPLGIGLKKPRDN